jgi:hypothetical protein
MDMRYLLVAPFALAFAGATSAAPANPAAKAEEPTVSRPATVVLASAEQVAAAVQSPPGQAVTPAKRPRAARVTSCRCAGQVGPPAQSDQ